MALDCRTGGIDESTAFFTDLLGRPSPDNDKLLKFYESLRFFYHYY